MQRLLIALYALWRNTVNRFSSKEDQKGRVLIIFQQVFGDAVVLMSALQGYVDLFAKQKGWRITLLCLPSIRKFLSDVASIPSEIEVEEVDFKKLVNEFGYFRAILRKYDHSAELTVVPGSSLSAELLSSSLTIKRRVGMVNVFPRNWPPQLALFYKLAYTEPIVPELGSMMIQRHRMTLRYLGLENYVGKLSNLVSQARIIPGKYYVICPGASTPVKRWPVERFAQIADYLIEHHNLDIYICGGADEEKDAMKLIQLSKYPYRMFSKVGRTSFWEWSSIVEYAQMVIGNDSATLHLAAAHRVKAICIAGVYDKFQFFPYVVDELDEGDFLPETVYVNMPCEYCRTKGYYAGYGNVACLKVVKQGRCALCVEAITVETVKEKINSLHIGFPS